MNLHRYSLKNPDKGDVFSRQQDCFYSDDFEWYFEDGRVGIRLLGSFSNVPFLDGFLTTRDKLYANNGNSPIIIRAEDGIDLVATQFYLDTKTKSELREMKLKVLKGTFKDDASYLNRLVEMLLSENRQVSCYLSFEREGSSDQILTFSYSRPENELYVPNESMVVFPLEGVPK